MSTAGQVIVPLERWVAQNEREVVEAIGQAAAESRALRISGAGTWMDAGRPVNADAVLDVSRLNGVIEYVPGDLTLTARAGTTLAEIDATVARHGQWLPLDPFGSSAGTLGAALATASGGPLAATIGRPRDLALGVGFVAGDGSIVHGGGRVVKNVAGFDLVRLTVGAWGTLGVIIEATVRLRAQPEGDTTVAVPLPRERAPLTAVLRSLRGARTAPLAMEIVSSTLAVRLGLDPRPQILVRLAGNGESLSAQRMELANHGAVTETAPEVWSVLRGAEPAGAITWRFSSRPSEIATLWCASVELLEPFGGEAHASLDRGVVRCWCTSVSEELVRRLERIAEPAGRVFERLPAELWTRLAPLPPTHSLHRAVRVAFDPHRILNPGILAEAFF